MLRDHGSLSSNWLVGFTDVHGPYLLAVCLFSVLTSVVDLWKPVLVKETRFTQVHLGTHTGNDETETFLAVVELDGAYVRTGSFHCRV